MRKILSQILILTGIFFIGGQNFFAQQKGTTTKQALVKEIANATISAFPSAIYQKMFDKAKSDSPSFIKDQVKKSFPTVLNRQTNLSAAQKKRLTENLPNLFIQLDAPINQIVANRFVKIDSLIADYFNTNLSDFSTSEIIEIDRFLKSPAGKNYLKQLTQITENLTAQKPKPLEIEEKYQSESSAFLASEIGTKYNNLFVSQSNEAMFAKLKQLHTLLLEDFNKDVEVGRIMNAFLKSAA